DGVAIDSGAEVVSEPLLIAQGASADLMDQYARSVGEQMHARSPDEVLTGWCSWYQLYTNVTEADVNRNLASLMRHRDQVPLRLVQLDDGYQRAVGDWLEVNEKFPGGMPALVRRIRDHGFAPGVWLAPFLLSARSRMFAEHPDWTVRDAYGKPLNAIDNWGCANFALDTTHPDVLRWLEHVVHTVCEVWGYDYLKLDFLYAAAMRGQRYDPRVTAVGAYRRGLEALRQAAGDRFILGCGAPLIPSIGLVDGMRIGSDVAAYWGAEGNADGPSLRNATRATLARLWLHGRWWANDPDCVIVRTSDTDLSPAEVQAWASVVALSGGMLFVGDDVSRLNAVELHTVGRLLPPSGVAAQATGPLFNFLPERLHLRIERPWGTWDIIALANWSETPRTVVFNPREFGLPSGWLHLFDLWSGDYLGRDLDARELGELDPHGVRLLTVHPDLGRPQVVGSTGHLLGDAMDLTHAEWDAGRRTLKLLPANTGPRARRGDLVVYDPDGPLRRVPFAVADARLIHLEFG
ncbi:MAG TPA: glycoside hydrolase family 36 protein, partial [Chloroflexota bacterium]